MNIAPHNAGQWVNCHGSVLMQTLYPTPPGEESEAAKDGKAFHHVVATVLTAMVNPDTRTPIMNDLVGEMAPNGVVIDRTMAQAAIDYATSIMKYTNEHGLLRKVQVEQRIDLSSILGDDKYGIPDVLIWDDVNGVLLIDDGKWGQRKVEAFENLQLILYALSYIDTVLKADGIADQFIKVRLRIYQPRYYDVEGPYREWETTASELRGYRNQIDYAVTQIRGNSPMCTPGEWCRSHHCSAAHVCPALQQSAYNYLDHINHTIPIHMDNASLAAEYQIMMQAEKLIKARKSAIEQQCIGTIEQGENIPGIDVKQGYGREKWRDGIDLSQIAMMGELMGVDVTKPTEVDTPAQCRKKGIDEAVIKAYSYTPKTSKKLVIDDGSKARQVFRKLHR